MNDNNDNNDAAVVVVVVVVECSVGNVNYAFGVC